MNLKKRILVISIGFGLFVSFIITNNQIDATPVKAADNVFVRGNSILKTLMHNAVVYNKNGKSTGKTYEQNTDLYLENRPVTINGNQYYKIANENLYIKPTNVDGVRRRVTHNAYIYRSSNRRTSFNGYSKLAKGKIVTTYGGSYKFKNGKHYFGIGGLAKQYVKSYNLGEVIGINTANLTKTNCLGKETTAITRTLDKYEKNVPVFTFDKNDKAILVKKIPKNTKLKIDYWEFGPRAENIAYALASFNGAEAIYHIKGTDYWIYDIYAKPKSSLPIHIYKKFYAK